VFQKEEQARAFSYVMRSSLGSGRENTEEGLGVGEVRASERAREQARSAAAKLRAGVTDTDNPKYLG
jgi:hypothetical protein